MATGKYKLTIPSSRDELEGVYMLMRTVFREEGVDLIIQRLLDHYPDMSLDQVMAIRHGGEIVAALILIPQTWEIDGLELKVAEMGCVATHPHHRGKGLQRILSHRFDDYAKSNGFDLCALAGIPYFYRQFGYEYAVDLDHSTSINADKMPNTHLSLEARPFQETDITSASQMLDLAQSRYFVRCPRTLDVWLMHHRTSHYNGEPYESVVLSEEGELKAYLRYSVKQGDATFILKEAGLKSPRYAKPLLSFIKGICTDLMLSKVVSKQFYDDEPTRTLIDLGGESIRPYAWQAKALDIPKFLAKLAPILEARLCVSGYGDLTTALNFNFRKFNVKMTLNQGKVVGVEENHETGDRMIGLNPYVFPQLLLGHRSLGELMDTYPDVRVRDSHRAIVEAMFPKKPGYIFHVY